MANTDYRGLLIWLAFSLVFLHQGFAQESTLIPYRKGNLWGYSDPAGNLIVGPLYERTFFLSPDGLARVKQKGLYGYVNQEGKLVIIPQYTSAGDFFLGVAEVEKKKRKFCINPDGEEEECNAADEGEPYEEDELQPFEVYRDSTGAQRLVFLNSGDTLPEAFDSVRLISRYTFPSRNYFALVLANKRWGAYNENGIQMAPAEFDAIDVLDIKSYKAMKDSTWGVRGFNGEAIIPFAYDSIAKVTDVQTQGETIARREHYIVGKQNQFGILDGQGNVVLPVTYDEIRVPPPCNCPLEFAVRRNRLYGLVDDTGKTILPIRFTFVAPFGGSRYTLVKDAKGREGYISAEGKEFFED